MAKAIHEENGKWFFWDETWSYQHGPFASREEAEKLLKKYMIEVLEYPPEDIA